MKRVKITLTPSGSDLPAEELPLRFTRATEILLKGFRRHQEAQVGAAKETAEGQGKQAA